jgi:hypothetical protein
MLRPASIRQRRKGQAMVEYTLLLAGVALACSLAVAVLGDHTADTLSVMATIMPGANAADNAPITAANVIPFTNGPNGLVLDTQHLVGSASAGTDRYAGLLGPGGGATLVVDSTGN